MIQRRVVIAVTQNEQSRSVLRAGRWLASATGRTLTICHIKMPSEPDHRAGMVLSTANRDVRDPDLWAFVDWLGEDALPNASVNDVEVVVGYGIPAIEIERIASGRNAPVIVIGHEEDADGDGAASRVGDALVRISTAPIWFTSPGQNMIGRMVAGIDGTERGFRVFDVASLMAARLGVFLDVVTVIPPVEVDVESDQMLRSVLRPRNQLRPPTTPIPGAADKPIVYRHGEPVDKILEFAVERAADVVVVGVRRGGPPKRIDPTQIARSLLAVAPMSVFTVPI